MKRRATSEWRKGGGGRAARTSSLLALLPAGARLPASQTQAKRTGPAGEWGDACPRMASRVGSTPQRTEVRVVAQERLQLYCFL